MDVHLVYLYTHIHCVWVVLATVERSSIAIIIIVVVKGFERVSSGTDVGHFIAPFSNESNEMDYISIVQMDIEPLAFKIFKPIHQFAQTNLTYASR